MPILNKDPSLKNVFKSFVFKDIFRVTGKPIKVHGVSVDNPDNMLKYIEDHHDQLKVLFGEPYVKNLKTINEVVRDVAFIQPKARPKFMEGGAITGFIRAYLGVFTRPGRMLTAANIVRKRAGTNALPALLRNPQKLQEVINVTRVSNKEKLSAQELGRIIADIINSPEDADVTKIKPTATESSIKQSELEQFGPSVMFPNLTDKALSLDYSF